MRYDYETQRKLDLRTFRFILDDFLYCKDRHYTPILEHSEKALVEWFRYITGLNVEMVDNKKQDH